MQAHTFLYTDSPPEYRVMFDALCESITRNSPSTHLVAHVVDSPEPDLHYAPEQPRRTEFINNTRKARYHRQVVEQAADGEVICFLDCDTLVMGEIDLEFFADAIAFTRGRYTRINSGVYFLVVGEKTREFLREWEREAIRLLFNPKDAESLYPMFGGIHQAALSRIAVPNLIIDIIPSAHWNCTAFDLPTFSEETRIVHLTGLLRSAVLGHDVPKSIAEQAAPIINEWNQCALVAA
jgi:hypothetical protein